ncbi:MAG: hypothetical protein HPY79_04400 [Bacteroidales bacterium]|nr:hypothetical protein [Bacteroidales bacterium]
MKKIIVIENKNDIVQWNVKHMPLKSVTTTLSIVVKTIFIKFFNLKSLNV